MRRSPPIEASFNRAAPRLACVRPVASVHPEPGSNSSLYYFIFLVFYSIEDFFYHPPSCERVARDSPVLTLTFFTRLVLLCLSFLQGSIRFPRSGWPPFYRESGCKDKGFLYSPPNIFATFFHIFFRTPSLRTVRQLLTAKTFFYPQKGKFCQRVAIGPKMPAWLPGHLRPWPPLFFIQKEIIGAEKCPSGR